MTATDHLRISGGALSVVVTEERRYSPCRLSDDNNNNYMLTHVGCLKAGPAQKQLARVHIILIQNSCERLPLEYMQTFAYTDTQNRTRISVNAA